MSPVLVTVYNRHISFSECIRRLLLNPEAKETVLYVSSDGPYCPDHSGSVEYVRDLIASIKGFKEVRPIFFTENLGAYEATQKAISIVLQEHDRLIFLEDDIVVSENFLSYMNLGLNNYRDRSDIFFICSYMWPGFDFSKFLKDDVFLWQGYSPWGMATWRDKWADLDFDMKRYQEFSKSPKMIKDFFNIDPDCLALLNEDAMGKVEAMDVRVSFNLFSLGKYSVFPVAPLSVNRGHDGGGDHGSDCNSYMYQELCEFMPSVPLDIKLNPEVDKYIYDKKFSFVRHRLRPFLMSIGIFDFLRSCLVRLGIYSYLKAKWVSRRGFS